MVRYFVNAIRAYFGAIKIIHTLNLWKFFTIPICISISTGVSIFTTAYFFSDNLGQLISKLWAWEWGAKTIYSISTAISAVLIITFGIIVYKHVVLALSAPFMSPVSERIESHMYQNYKISNNDTSFWQQLIRGIKINMRNLAKELCIVILLLIVSFIPVVGIASTVLIFITQAYYVGFGNMDYTMERHFGYQESVHFVRNHRGMAIGNGAVFMILLFIPFIGFIITLPLAVVAASRVTIKEIYDSKSNRTTMIENI